MAEFHAKIAVRDGIDTQLLIPFKDFSSFWKDIAQKEFIEWCHRTSNFTSKLYFSNFYHEGRDPWYKHLNLNSKAISSISRLRSGHTSLKASLHRFKITADPDCLCGEEQTVEHILFQCEHLNVQRDKFLKTIWKNWGYGPINANYILSASDSEIILALGTFINDINVNI